VAPQTPVGEVGNLEEVVAISKKQLEDNKDRPFRWTTGDRRAGNRYWVYGRKGNCLRCGTQVRKADLGQPGQQRPTYWCPHCQPAP
jgi:endonuclease-8